MKIKFVKIVMAGITQKKLKSYIFIAVPFEKLKRKTSVYDSVVKKRKSYRKKINQLRNGIV